MVVVLQELEGEDSTRQLETSTEGTHTGRESRAREEGNNGTYVSNEHRRESDGRGNALTDNRAFAERAREQKQCLGKMSHSRPSLRSHGVVDT
jgi:hypothetical protein